MFKPNLEKNALQVLEDNGAIKKTTEKRRAEKKLTSSSNIQSLVRLILRSVMRHPNDELYKQLVFLHGKIKENFEAMSDLAIEFLLSYSAKEARGGFKKKLDKETNEIIKTPEQKFREFLAQDPHTINSQLLLTKIETILAAMAYLYSGNIPETEQDQLMVDKIEALMKDKIVERIKLIYPTRTTDLLAESNYFVIEPDDVSSASEAEEEDYYPPSSPMAKFFSKSESPNLSWPEAAIESGIPIRAHVSASSTLLLAAIDALYDSGNNRSDWFKLDANAKMLSGALLLPTLERADYHTIAESAAGINFYLAERAKNLGQNVQNKPMMPTEAFEDALTMLENAANNNVISTYQMSLQTAIKIIKQKLLDIVTEIKAVSSVENKNIKF